MIDTHCHLLPGLDDGPRTDLEAVSLARQLVAAGVGYVLCTPHFSRVFPTSADRATDAAVRLSEHLDTLGIPLRLGVAAEVNEDLLPEAARDTGGRAIDGRWLIVELHARTPAGALDEACATLGAHGLAPVFAHPERCREVSRFGSAIAEARAAGALFQVVAPSLAGRWGDEVQSAAWALLDAGSADLVASDAHRPSRRRTLGSVLERIRVTYGRDALVELTERAPSRVLGLDASGDARPLAAQH